MIASFVRLMTAPGQFAERPVGSRGVYTLLDRLTVTHIALYPNVRGPSLQPSIAL